MHLPTFATSATSATNCVIGRRSYGARSYLGHPRAPGLVNADGDMASRRPDE
jgi:hypothetical protein